MTNRDLLKEAIADAKAFREHVGKITPGLDLKFTYTGENGAEREAALPIGLNFFWPDA